jgi:hypothetical protein
MHLVMSVAFMDCHLGKRSLLLWKINRLRIKTLIQVFPKPHPVLDFNLILISRLAFGMKCLHITLVLRI